VSLNLLTIGKLKNTELEKLCNDYEKRITSPSLKIVEIKAYSENPEKEANEAIKKLSDISSGNAFHILLTEWGKKFESVSFSKWLQDKIENHSQVNFIIAGAEGPHQSLKDFCHAELSLSGLTYPHKLARLILTEQLYRAQTIRQGHPYHN
jgi:23S rRNA (pseudouridine1915-N3)-methyltransferase